VRGPKPNTVLEDQCHQCRGQWHDHFLTRADRTIPDTSQDAFGLLGHLSTLLVHVQLAVKLHPKILLHWTAFQPLFPKPITLRGVVVTEVEGPTLGLVEPHTVGLSPSIQSVQMPLQSLPTLKQINTPTQLVPSANLLREDSILSSRSLIKILNKTGPKTEPWGTPLVTSHQLDLTPFTTTLCAQPFSQFLIQ